MLGPRLAATAMTAAMIGPTHGAQISPIAPPRIRPPASPLPDHRPARGAPRAAAGPGFRASQRPTRGNARLIPTAPSTTAPAGRSVAVVNPAAARADASRTVIPTNVNPKP